MALIDALSFDIVGACTTSQGIIPTFKRGTVANGESEVNGSWRIFPAAVHQPRFSTTGALLMERESSNLCPFPLGLTDSGWVKGSSIEIREDRVPAMDNNYLADVIAVFAYTGNQDAQIMTRSIQSGSGKTYTVTWWLSLLGGQFGPNDVLRVTGDVVSVESIALAEVYNDRVGNYIPVTVTVTAAGTELVFETGGEYRHPVNEDELDEVANDPTRTLNIQLYCESAVSIAWGGCQIEPGELSTTFISQDANILNRDTDFLEYPKSPAEGLDSFVFYASLDSWKGDGRIVEAGTFSVEVSEGKLRASCGAVTATDPDDLPETAKIAVRVSRGLERLQVYVNGVLKVRETLSGYSGNASPLRVAGDGVRMIRCLYFFNRDLSDGSIGVGDSVGGSLAELHSKDSLLVNLGEGHSRIFLPAFDLAVGETKAVRFPQYQLAAQRVNSITTGSGATAQVETVTVRTVANSTTYDLFINATQYSYTSDSSATDAEIAAWLASAVNASPRTQPVTASYSSGSSFTITADVAGDDFSLTVGGGLSKAVTTPNAVNSNTIAVDNAIDFETGAVQIFRDYAFVCDLAIASINTGTNTLTVKAVPNSLMDLVQVDDVIMQPTWSLEVGPNNYFCHHLEDFGDVRIKSKSLKGFTLKNEGLQKRRVTPYAKITL